MASPEYDQKQTMKEKITESPTLLCIVVICLNILGNIEIACVNIKSLSNGVNMINAKGIDGIKLFFLTKKQELT